MRSIGVVSDESAGEILCMLNQAVRRMDILPGLCDLSDGRPGKMDMLIINSYKREAHELLKYLNDNSLVIINSDEKKLNGEMSNFGGRVVSYGFNQKACVTASSVEESEFTTVQCCIQRRLPTFSGAILEQQEFSVSVPIPGASAINVLAYATAALLNDIPICEISCVPTDAVSS